MHVVRGTLYILHTRAALVKRFFSMRLRARLTNPEDRIVYALTRYTTLRAFGFCDGLWDFRTDYAGKLLGIPGEFIHVHGAGINHAVWITDLRDNRTGHDLYPKLVELARKNVWQPFGLFLFDTFGLWPHENDEHYGEYFQYAHQFFAAKGYDFESYAGRHAERRKMNLRLIGREIDPATYLQSLDPIVENTFGDTPPSLVLRGAVLGEPAYIPNANVVNAGCIAGLPDDMVVEVPAIATATGVFGIRFVTLPDEITAILHREAVIQKLAAEAAVEGSRKKALLALLMDPHVRDPQTAERLLDAFTEAHGDLFPPGIRKPNG